MIVPPWLKKWIQGDDTGTSSLTIAHSMVGAADLLQRSDAPHDTSDVGRCVRLLDKAAENGEDWRSRMAEVVGVCPAWKPLLPIWADVEAAYREDRRAQDEVKSAYDAEWNRRYFEWRLENNAYWDSIEEAKKGNMPPADSDGVYLSEEDIAENAPMEPESPDVILPPSRCWWLVSMARGHGDPYNQKNPHPFK